MNSYLRPRQNRMQVGLTLALALGMIAPAFGQRTPPTPRPSGLSAHPLALELRSSGHSLLTLGLLAQPTHLRGLSVAGLLNRPHGSGAGLRLAGVANFAPESSFAGVSIAPLANIQLGTYQGLQLGLLNRIFDGRGIVQLGAFNGAHRISGLQTGALTTTGELRGVQLSSFASLSTHSATGLQLSAVNVAGQGSGLVQLGAINAVAGTLRGVQLGAYNYVGKLTSAQIGIINTSGESTGGVQLGLVNYAQDTYTKQVGLINIRPETRLQLRFGAGTLTRGNFALRFRGQRGYSEVALGIGYRSLGAQTSGSIAYHRGLAFALTPRLSVLGDLGIAHIEDTPLKKDGEANRRFAFAGRLTLEYSFSRLLSAYATGGYAYSRRYQRPSADRYRPIFEAGITLF